MFQDASFTVSCCNLQHSLSTRKDCHCMRHATPCIRHEAFACTMQTHACAMQLHACAMHPLHATFPNIIASKQLNQSDASIIRVFDFCWYQLHMSSGTTAMLNSAPMYSALAVNSESRSSIRLCHFDLTTSIQLIMLLLLCGHLVAKFNS